MSYTNFMKYSNNGTTFTDPLRIGIVNYNLTKERCIYQKELLRSFMN